jgi:hypothetical protein
MAYLTVTTQVDVVDPGDGKLSLREAIATANATSGTDTIQFVATLAGKQLVLRGGELNVTQDVRINGAGVVTIDGNQSSRILNVSGSGTDVELLDITLAHGRSPNGEHGGAVLLGGGSLVMRGATVQESAAGGESNYGAGGGVFADSGSRLTLTSSSIIGNVAGLGGGIGANSASISIRGSLISSNSGYSVGGGSGGGISVSNGALTLEDSVIAGNGSGDGLYGGSGGGLIISGGTTNILRSSIIGNGSAASGGRY